MGNEPQDQVVPPAEPIEVREDEIEGRTPEPKPEEHATRNILIVGVGFIVVVAVVALLLVAGDKTEGGMKPSAAGPAYVPATHTVVYEADGSGARGLRTVNYTIQTDDGGTSQGTTNLPMKNKAGGTGLTFTGFNSGDFVYLSVQNEDAAGDVTCRIVIDGVTISENTSSGGYTIATCKGSVP
jgi:hypothetical protein